MICSELSKEENQKVLMAKRAKWREDAVMWQAKEQKQYQQTSRQ